MSQKNIKGQIIASTNEDSQGERLSKKELEDIKSIAESRKRVNIGKEHNPANKHIGYFKNFKIEPLDNGEYCLTADAYFIDDILENLCGGFSWSLTKLLPNQNTGSLFHIYLPYPFYNDVEYQNSFDLGTDISFGSWKKKSADPETIALIVNCIKLALGIYNTFKPTWEDIYKSNIEPKLQDILTKIKGDKNSNPKYDYIQLVQHPSGYCYKVYFLLSKVPSNDEIKPFRFRYGLRLIKDYLNQNVSNKQITMITMMYVDDNRGFQIWSIEYDDSDIEYL